MKILIVSQIPTHPVNAGNRKGILNQVEILKELGHEVYFFYIDTRPLFSKSVEESDHKQEEYWGDHLLVWRMPWMNHLYQMIIQRNRIYFNNGYLKVDDMYPSAISNKIKKLQEYHKFDCCIVNYYYLSKLFTKVHFPFEAMFTHDYFAYKSILVGLKTVGYNTTAHEEAIAMQRSKNIFAVNTEEAIYFSKLSPKSRVFNIFSPFFYHSMPVKGNKTLLFFSGDNIFNINGIYWFLKHIFPLIYEKWPDIKLIIGGSICKKLNDIASANIQLKGFVEDPVKFYELGDIVINPTYEGTGLKIKTFEAISYDKIVMAHPHSISGMYDIKNIPVFSSIEPANWIEFLDNIWNNSGEINKIKEKNSKYLESLNKFIISEYKRFFSQKD